jgi:tetratricopeptide (TPR) repeat protein
MEGSTGEPVRGQDSIRERRSTVYTFLGLAIVVAVVVTSVWVIPWRDLLKGREDRNFIEGSAALARQKWNEAIVFFGKSLESNPGNAAAYVGRSRAYLQLNDLDRALDEVNQAVKYDPRSSLAYGQRGIVLKVQGRTVEALEDFGRAVKITPHYSWAFAQIADIQLRKNDFERALENCNRALEINPSFVEGLRLRSRILSRAGKCREAFEDLNKAIKLRPDDPLSLQDTAWYLLTCPDEKIQDPSKAFELAQKAFDLSQGTEALVQETLAEAYFRQGDAGKAAEHQRKAVDLQKQKCPDGSCAKEMLERLQKYELAARREKREDQDILPLDSGYFR